MGRGFGVDSASCAYRQCRRAVGGLPGRSKADPGRRVDVRPQHRPPPRRERSRVESFCRQRDRSRFPKGLTVLNAAGEWRDAATNRIVREPSKVVQIVLPGQVEDIARLDEIVAAYKQRFKQHSVIMIVRPACVSF